MVQELLFELGLLIINKKSINAVIIIMKETCFTKYLININYVKSFKMEIVWLNSCLTLILLANMVSNHINLEWHVSCYGINNALINNKKY